MTTRRNFIKETFLSLGALSILGRLENSLLAPNTPQEAVESKLYYSVSGINCTNPCGEIIPFGDKGSAEEYAFINEGVVNYAGTLNGKKVEGSYRVLNIPMRRAVIRRME